MPAKSLSRSLTRRVSLLSLIAAVGLAGTIILGALLVLNQIQTRMDQINAQAINDFDQFFLDIQSDLQATSDGLISRTDKNSALLNLRQRNPAFLEVLLVDSNGKILAQRNAVGHPERTRIEQQEWLESPPGFGEVIIGPVRLEGQTPYVDMAITTTDDIGLSNGLLLVRVGLTQLWNTTLDIKVGDTGYTYITDNAGQLVAYRNLRLLETGDSLDELVGHSPQVITASRLSFYIGLSGEPVLASAQPLKTVPWFAVVEQPIYEIIIPLLIPVLVLSTALILVGLLLFNTLRFTNHRIVSPLLNLRDAVVKMADGQFQQNIEIWHDDEFGELANSFNYMASQLIQAFTELENQIDTLQKTQTALMESEFRIRSISNNITAGMIYQVIIQTDHTQTFTYLSDSVRQLYGISPEEGMADSSLIYGRVHEDDIDFLIKVENEAMESLSTFRVEIRVNDPSGGIRWSSLVSTPRTLEDGSICWDGIEFVITERKQAELEREKLITELSEKNAELEQFTYIVSHDLKSPLVTINGYLGYLEQDAASGNLERLKKDTQRIREAANKMHILLTDLLELSRIGHFLNESQDVPFNDIVQDSLELVHGYLISSDITVQTQPNLPTVHGDRQRLIEVLQNLIDNAAKHMGSRANSYIMIGVQGEEDGMPIFFVRDNGIGIAPEYHERIFGLFNKLDAKSEGTGVGLTLVKRIIEFHGGRIWVESEVGKGATFFFTLPRR